MRYYTQQIGYTIGMIVFLVAATFAHMKHDDFFRNAFLFIMLSFLLFIVFNKKGS